LRDKTDFPARSASVHFKRFGESREPDMSVSLRPLSEQVFVITGASSGIGLATAKAAAQRGAKVVLNSRNGEALDEIVQDITSSGGEATYVVGDVSFRGDMEKLARTAVDRFGRIDTWVNNAGLSIYGRLQDVTEEDHRRLFDINFWGVVNGSLAALPHLKRQGGALINVGSEVSDIALPVQAMYSVTKHAVKGFTDSLRMELMEEGAPVSVTLVKPASIDTPFTQHAKNYMGKAPTLPSPVYTPDVPANAILYAAEHPSRDVYAGGASKLFSMLNRVAPHLVDWVNAHFMSKQQLRDEPSSRKNGALYKAGKDGQTRGDASRDHLVRPSLYTNAMTHPIAASLMVAAAGAAMAAAISAERSRH
jgi:short-subunit dehydrogenase